MVTTTFVASVLCAICAEPNIHRELLHPWVPEAVWIAQPPKPVAISKPKPKRTITIPGYVPPLRHVPAWLNPQKGL